MNLKQFMEQKADEEFSSVLSESEKEYCRQLEAEYPVQSIRDKRRLWVFFSCAFAILIAAVITISIVFAPHSSPLKYQGEKKSITSTIIELNNDTKYFEVSIPQNTTSEIKMYYDAESGDKLYYRDNNNGIVEKCSLIIVINRNYIYEFEKPVGEERKKQLGDFEINFIVVNLDGDGSTQYYAWVQLNTETTYITYTQIMSLGDQAFFDYVQSVIKVK